MIEVWDQHLLTAAQEPTVALSGVRRIINGFHWEWDIEDLKKLPIEFPDLGYASRASKMRQLDRNYHNPASWETALQVLDERGKKVSAIPVSLNAAAKESRSMGFCMLGGVLFRERGVTELTVFYRSTEFFQKQTADLLWFRERVPGCVSRIRFMAATAYMSAMFFPIYARFVDRPDKLIRLLDPPSLKTVGGNLRPFLRYEHDYGYKQTIKMWDYFHKHVNAKKFKYLDAACPKRPIDLMAEVEDDDD
jgi:hypothetical protein